MKHICDRWKLIGVFPKGCMNGRKAGYTTHSKCMNCNLAYPKDMGIKRCLCCNILLRSKVRQRLKRVPYPNPNTDYFRLG